MIRILWGIFLCFICVTSFAQDSSFDRINERSIDTKTFELVNDTSDIVFLDSINRLIEINIQIADLSLSLEDWFAANKAYNKIADQYFKINNLSKSIKYYKEALEIGKKSINKSEYAISLNSLGILYRHLGNFSQAIFYFEASLIVKRELFDNHSIANTLNNIGGLYAAICDYESALAFYSEALSNFKELNDNVNLSKTKNNIGNIHYKLKYFKKALEYYNESLFLNGKTGDLRPNSIIYNNIALVYVEQKYFRKALEFYQKSLSISELYNDEYEVARCFNNIGDLYLDLNNYESAKRYFDESLKLAIEENIFELLMRNYESFARLYEEQDLFQESLTYYKLFINFQDSSLNEQAKNKLLELQVKYETETAQKENDFLKQNNRIQQLEIKTKEKQIWILYLVSLLIIVIIGFVYRWFLLKQKANINLVEKNSEITRQKNLLEETLKELNRSEDKNRAILLGMPDLIFVFNRDGYFIHYHGTDNSKLYSQPEEFLGKPVWEVLPEGISKEITTAIHNASVTKKVQVFDYEIEIQSEIRKFEARFVPTKNNEFLSINRDITDKSMMEEALKNAKDIAEKDDQIKSMYLATMSHEIRTPLSGIIGMTGVLEDTPLNSEQEECVNVITTSGNNLLSILNNILDYSKIEAGQLYLENIEFNLNEKIEEVFKLIEIKASENNIHLESSISKDIPDCVIGDPLRLKQILLNLINNAVKFTKNGNVEVKVDLVYVDTDILIIKYSVIDTGRGISTKDQEKLFTAFSQSDISITREYGGTGLGLIISKQLAELMNGEIGFESELGMGSNFWFTCEFSQCVEEKEQKTISNITEEVSIMESDPAKVLNILLVEDNMLNQKFALAILKRRNHIVDIADNGKIGVDKFKEREYDLILMDIQMPVMDGMEATRQIRRYEQDHGNDHIKIIAVTAYALDGDEQKILNCGVDEYLRKPYKAEELIQMIE